MNPLIFWLPNLRNSEGKIAIRKYIIIGVVVGIVLGFLISVIEPNYLISLWGDGVACPIKTGGRNIIGCNAGFIYSTVLAGGLLGAVMGLLIGLLRKFFEKRSNTWRSIKFAKKFQQKQSLQSNDLKQSLRPSV